MNQFCLIQNNLILRLRAFLILHYYLYYAEDLIIKLFLVLKNSSFYLELICKILDPANFGG